jgi:t-SNARE complex subunit (syntaxin)
MQQTEIINVIEKLSKSIADLAQVVEQLSELVVENNELSRNN